MKLAVRNGCEENAELRDEFKMDAATTKNQSSRIIAHGLILSIRRYLLRTSVVTLCQQ